MLLGLAAAGIAAPTVVVEDWGSVPAGTRGIPPGWEPYRTPGGRPAYDLAVVEVDGRRALRLRSRDERSTIARSLSVDLSATPVLEWEWKAVQLPAGADVRLRARSDLTAHVLVVWPGTPAFLRSRILGYVWEAAVPAGAVEASRKTRTVTFVVVRSGHDLLGRWLTERRDVAADYRKVFGEDPPAPAAVALSIDTNDTHSVAEGYIGAIRFRGR